MVSTLFCIHQILHPNSIWYAPDLLHDKMEDWIHYSDASPDHNVA